MRKSLFHVLGATAVLAATLLATTAASAAPHIRAGPAPTDPDTTITFTVTTSFLSMTAPATADLGPGAPGTTISGALGTVTVVDDRAALAATWTATASSTDFTNTTIPAAASIPAGDATYGPGTIASTGTITAAADPDTPITLSGTAQPVVDATAGVGDNTGTWDPTIAVNVPIAAVNGGYTGTLTQSVT